MGRKKKERPGQKGGPKEPGQIPVKNPLTGIFEWAGGPPPVNEQPEKKRA